MKVRATVRAFFLFLITVAAAAFIFLPFAEVTTESFVTTTETIPFYQILNFEPRIYTLLNKEINDLLNLLKEPQKKFLDTIKIIIEYFKTKKK